MGLAGFGSRQKSSQSCVSQFSDIGNDGALVSAIKIWYSRMSRGLAHPIPINQAIPKAPGKEGSMNKLSEYPEDAFGRMVGEWIAPPAANPEPSMRIAPHSAPQCM